MAYDNRRSNGDYGRKSYNRGGYGQKDFERDIARDSKPYKKLDGRKPYGKKLDDRQDKPYKKFDDKREDRPFKEKPFKDKPFKDKPLDKAAEDRREAPNTNEPDELPYIIMGRNAVREAVKSGRSIDRILVSKELDGSLREVVNLARDNNIQIREVDRYKLDEICMPFGHGGKPGNHQGILAQVPGVEYCDISDILRAARDKDEKPFIILLDGVEDPHNLGSIIRSAECAGAHGVIIQATQRIRDRSGLQGFCGRGGVHEGGPGIQPCGSHRPSQGRRAVDSRRGHGGHRNDKGGPEGRHRLSDRQRGRRSKQAHPREVRLSRVHTHERAYRFPQRGGGRSHTHV